MRLSVDTDIELNEPHCGLGLVTWYRVRVTEKDRRGSFRTVGRLRAARLHLGLAADLNLPWERVFGTSLGELGALCRVFLNPEQDDLRPAFQVALGRDLMFIESVRMDTTRRGRNIELAAVRRLVDVLGAGCELAILPYASNAEALLWSRLGFQVSTPGEEEGFMHLACGGEQPRTLETDVPGEFQVVPVRRAPAHRNNRACVTRCVSV
ncbi:MAG TPA: hypothetical protein VFQ61_26635 [Polyangiaceae bacterium]|nr:hypothetical protein [Polyangiaceae bacterium]